MLYLILLGLGFIVGSFLGVLIDRIPRAEGFLTGRSYCEHCGHALGFLDLIPVFSFLALRGRCRYCHVRLSSYYLVIELATGAIFAFTACQLDFVNSSFLAFFLIIMSALIVIFFTDLKYGIIPDKVLFPTVFIVLFWLFYTGQNIALNLLVATCSLIFFLFIYLITKGRGMGFGDVKLSFMLGLLVGFPGALFSFYIAFLTGAGVSIILILSGKKKLKGSHLPFGPFLVFGALLNLYFPQELQEIFFKITGFR